MSQPQPRWLRPALAAAALGVAVLTIVLNNCWCDVDRLLARLALVGVVLLAWAADLLLFPRLPRWALTIAVIVPIGILIVSDNGSVGALFFLLVVGWVTYTGSARECAIVTGLAMLAILGYVRFDTPDRWLPWILGIGATGLMMHLLVVQQSLVAQLRVAQADLARQAAADERRRIAGEIHDVAAHSLAVMLLHLTGARLRVRREHGEAWLVDALADAERMGRQGLDDVRRTVGLLHEGGNGAAPPLPGAAELPALVEEYRAAGLDVSFAVSGELTLPAAMGLAVYRIVQEALANAVKHAPGSPVELCLEVADTVRLRIGNQLLGQVGVDRGTGLGLGGMRERARLLGGTLQAGPRDAEWIVECQLPR